MPSIQLKAKLRAYTRAPFYTDTVREAPKDDKQYVRLNGEWQPLDTSLLKGTLEEYKEQLIKLQGQLDAVDIEFLPTTNQLVFIDGYGNKTFITLPQARVDHKTLGVNDQNNIYVMDTPDNKTIRVVDIETKPREDDPYYQQKISGKLRVDAVYAENTDIYLSGQNILDRLDKAEKNISDLESYTQGTGGFLDPYNFGNLTFNENRDSILNQYAYDILFEGKPSLLPDQTKVKNTFDGHIWVYVQDTNTWLDEGADTIVNANNDGVLGAVTGVKYNPEDPKTKFKISIGEDGLGNANGIMSVNGLEEEFEKVVYDREASIDALPATYVKRTTFGTIATKDSEQDSDAVNQGQFTRWWEETSMSDEDIFNIVNTLYIPDNPLQQQVEELNVR